MNEAYEAGRAKAGELIEARGTGKYVVLVEWDNTDASIYGPFPSSRAAQKALEEIEEKFDGWEWDHHEGSDVVELLRP